MPIRNIKETVYAVPQKYYQPLHGAANVIVRAFIREFGNSMSESQLVLNRVRGEFLRCQSFCEARSRQSKESESGHSSPLAARLVPFPYEALNQR